MSDHLKQTLFTQFHQNLGAKFTAFAGYQMPVSFSGALSEHLYVRSQNGVGLFDVSHMGQITLEGDDVSKAFEKLVPSNIQSLKDHHAKYTVLMNDQGGIIDDCIVTKNPDGSLFLVVNGSRKQDVLTHLQNALPSTILIRYHVDFGLLALQGSGAVDILSELNPDIAGLKFMQSGIFDLSKNLLVRVTRCGYTGADGFEISILPIDAEAVYGLLTQSDKIQSCGLASRDTLRLEAGLCLYGQDIDMQTSPLEADLSWLVSKQRTQDHNYIGSQIIQSQFDQGIKHKRVGLLPQTKAPMRQGIELFNNKEEKIGYITSGTYSPSLERPIAMGYVKPEYAQADTEIFALLRGKMVAVHITQLPFIPYGYVR